MLAACGGATGPAAVATTAPAAATTAPAAVATIAPAPTTAAAAPTEAAAPTAAEAPTAAAGAATEEPTVEPTKVVKVDPNAVKVDPNKVQIRWYCCLGTGEESSQLEVEQKIVEQFNASHPKIQLIFEAVTYNAARDTLATEIAAGNPPDIVGPVGVGGANAFAGQWLDMSEQIKKTNFDLTQFDKAAVDFWKVGGEGQVGLPFALYPSFLYYQKPLFDEAGLKYPPHKYGEKYVLDGKEVEWNFDTLTQIAKLLTVDEQGKDATDPAFDPTKITQYGFNAESMELRDIGSTWGADHMVEKDGTTARIPPQWAEAWKWYYDGIWKSHFIPNQSVADSAAWGAGNNFNTGKIAMSLSYLWDTGSIDEGAGDKWDIAAVPSYKGKVTANLNADTFRIFKSTKHPDEAFEVLTYLFGDAAPALLETYGAMPAHKADQAAFFDALNKKYPQKPDWQVAIDSIAYADNPSFESNVPNFNEFLDRNSTFFTLIRNTPDLDLGKEIEKYKADLQAIFAKKS
jgi:multiple sugar transport system substrate-binding protein